MNERSRELQAALQELEAEWGKRRRPTMLPRERRAMLDDVLERFSDVPPQTRAALLQGRAGQLWLECAQNEQEIAGLAVELAGELSTLKLRLAQASTSDEPDDTTRRR